MIKNSRLVFIDSEINTIGNKARAKVIIPSHSFCVSGTDRMRLTLQSFEMRRNWYSVNQTNNIFYFYHSTNDVYTEVTIPAGSYDTFDKLAAAIQVGVRVVYSTATCTFNDETRKFALDLQGADAAVYVVCFQVKQGTRPAGVSVTGFFQDSYELLGGVPSRTETPVNALEFVQGIRTSPFPAALNTLEAIYLRCNLMGGNFQTYGHERYLPDQNGLTETQIFARIPLTRACFDPIFEFVTYEDANDLFQLNLQQKTIDSLELYVTDDKGRLLAEVDPQQADLGLLSFKCVLRWDHLVAPPPPAFVPTKGGIDQSTHVPEI